ncbi:MAG: undecaprenyl/decaprenyl-phosphate alpha-N-acetylglucosaminyl 1-phosphate transferase [Pyrinomonadaceae bacterium]|nr:undecaprenyl/decaprenyl-phosphate alpha-N-acetylglucosaminyl 1-phosphate transferase [Pyrinomonadaceae bacterium]
MNTYLALFMIAICLSLTLTPAVRRICERYGWLDEPRDERRIHRVAVPRLGGVAIFISVLFALAALAFINNAVTDSLKTHWPQLLAALVPAALIFLLGVYDDLRNAGAPLKFAAEALAAALFYALGGRIEVLSAPFVGSVELPAVLSFAVTVIWIVAITNAFNLIDGIDGLAAGAALFASFVMVVLSVVLGHPFVTVVALALAGALVGFLRYNFNPASIFLGDSGSLFIGFTLATLSVQGTQKASTAVAVAIPLMAFGVPIVDTGLALVRRIINRRPLFQGDREHIHHMLLARGWSERRVAFVLYGVCALFGLQALLFIHQDAGVGRATGLGLFVAAAAVFFAVERLRYHEVEEIRAGVKRNISLAERRLRTVNHIRVRRASHALSKATTLDELFAAVREVLELSEFVYATVQLGCGDAARSKRLLERERKSRLLQGAEVRDGCIRWSWERGDVEAAEIIGSDRFWSLRLSLPTERAGRSYINLYREIDGDDLLIDINYLCRLFQRQMALAAERVLGAGELEASSDGLAARSEATPLPKVSGLSQRLLDPRL